MKPGFTQIESNQIDRNQHCIDPDENQTYETHIRRSFSNRETMDPFHPNIYYQYTSESYYTPQDHIYQSLNSC